MPETSTTIEIPADVRDNSRTVTDYAFRRDLAPDKGVRSVIYRNGEILNHETFGYDWYLWESTNPDGQRCRFDWFIRRSTGETVYFFHTEYFTRVACAECEYSYASVYQLLTEESDGEILPAVPRCDHHADRFRRLCAREGTELLESEPLRIGQHD